MKISKVDDATLQMIQQYQKTEKVEDRLPSISDQILSRSRLERIINDFKLYPELRARAPIRRASVWNLCSPKKSRKPIANASKRKVLPIFKKSSRKASAINTCAGKALKLRRNWPIPPIPKLS